MNDGDDDDYDVLSFFVASQRKFCKPLYLPIYKYDTRFQIYACECINIENDNIRSFLRCNLFAYLHWSYQFVMLQ